MPIISEQVTSLRLSVAFSRRRRDVSIARRITTINWSILKGFSMKSYAPCLIAATAISILPWPEIITTGTSGLSRLTDLRISIPSIRLSLSQISRINRPGGSELISAIHSSELPARRVVYPSSSRISETSSRISRSSSTIRMSLIFGLLSVCLFELPDFLALHWGEIRPLVNGSRPLRQNGPVRQIPARPQVSARRHVLR